MISDSLGRVAMTNVSAGQVVILCSGPNLFGGRVLTLPPDRTTTVQLVMVQRDPAERTIGAAIDVVSRSIDHLDADGPATRAGLQIDDEIEAVDGRSVTDLFGEPLQAVITNRPAGAQATLSIRRAGTLRDIAVTVANP